MRRGCAKVSAPGLRRSSAFTGAGGELGDSGYGVLCDALHDGDEVGAAVDGVQSAGCDQRPTTVTPMRSAGPTARRLLAAGHPSFAVFGTLWIYPIPMHLHDFWHREIWCSVSLGLPGSGDSGGMAPNGCGSSASAGIGGDPGGNPSPTSVFRNRPVLMARVRGDS